MDRLKLFDRLNVQNVSLPLTQSMLGVALKDFPAAGLITRQRGRLSVRLTLSLINPFFREHTFTLTMKNGASGRRKASRLSTGTSKTETSSDLQPERRTTHDRRTDGRTAEDQERGTDGRRADG